MLDQIASNADGPASTENRDSTRTVLKAMRAQFVKGGLTLLAGTGLVGLMNLAHNIVVARLLGPSGYGQAAAVFTLLMLISAITLAFQLLCAKLVASHDTLAGKAGLYVLLHRRAWIVGITVGLMLIALRSPISAYLNLSDPLLIILLGFATAFYIPLGVRRGYVQGTCEFNALAGNFIVEGLARLAGAFLLIRMGMGITGAVGASVAAILVAWLFAKPAPDLGTASGEIRAPFREVLQTTVFFAGQVIINNFDIVLVKHFFASEDAGLYAAVALVGRLVNVCSSSVVNSMFPVSAKLHAVAKRDTSLLLISLLLVFAVVVMLVGGLLLVPSLLWRFVYGAQFDLDYGRISTLLVLYAIVSGLYALSSVIIAYEMSHKIANTGWLQLAFSGALIAGIYWFHASLIQVVMVQLVLMVGLLLAVLAPFLWTPTSAPSAQKYRGNIRYLRSLSEEEVIGEFLKNELPHTDFADYRDAVRAVVEAPDFEDSRQNELRKNLLFLRRGPMWRELPPDTKWFEVELSITDLAQVRVFPRAPWRRIADGSLELSKTVESIRSGPRSDLQRDFFSKIQQLVPLVRDNLVNRTVLLIGTDKDAPLTLLDGNHRIAAAMLIDPSVALTQFRLICGFSQGMTDCCWYRTNPLTLMRYTMNMVRFMHYDAKKEIARLSAG
jgi:O-antigen/teichoic acid export membrane protein